MGWVGEILKIICIFFDAIIYSLSTICYVLFAAMCEMNVSAIGETFSNLVGRIKLFIGILMLFVVSFNLLKALVEPDTAGNLTSKMVQKIAIAIVLLVSSNFIFNVLDEFQEKLIQSNFIENLVLGNQGESEEVTELSSYDKYVSSGKFFSYNLFFAFVDTSGNPTAEKVKDEIMGTSGTATKTLFDITDVINDQAVYYRYPVISGAVGILLAMVFISFALDIGVRAFTLILLQVIAPIPIILYITPKGDSMLSAYLKAYMTCYVELFVKIFIIYITLYLMQFTMKEILVTRSNSIFPGLSDSGMFFKGLLMAIVIVALFLFAKKIPDLLQSILGIKLGSGSINPFKITGNVLKTGAHLGMAGLGAAGGAAIGAAATIGTGAGLGGALRAAGKGLAQGASSGYRVNNVRGALNSAFTGTAENFRAQRQYGYGLGDQGGSSGVRAQRRNAGNERNIAEARRRMEVMQQFEERRDRARNTAESSSFRQGYTGTRVDAASGATRSIDLRGARTREDYVAAMSQRDQDSLTQMINGGYSSDDIQAQRERLNETVRLANEDVDFARDYTFAADASDTTTEVGMEVFEADNLVRANQDVFQRAGIGGAAGMNNLHNDINNPGGLREQQQQIVVESSSNAVAREAAEAQARGAANATRHGNNNNT